MTRPLDESLQAATRLVLDSVSYSNPLPDWSAPNAIDYDVREALLARRVDDYLGRRARPKPGVTISVPRRNGTPKTWVVPSVNDQILLQVCALRLAHVAEAQSKVDYSRVFSYEINRVPSRLAFTQDQLTSWDNFMKETGRRVAGRQILQFDLEQAYLSIDLARFLDFYRKLAGDGDEVALLEVLLRNIGGPGGLPLINNSIFYLGNVYLTIVDTIVRDHTDDFIRFVDDYRVFDSSQTKLARMFASINKALTGIGFRTNPRKTRLGDENDFVEAVQATQKAAPSTAPNPEASDYNVPLVADDVVNPEALAALIAAAAKHAGDLTEGMGRFLMQSLRRVNDDPSLVAVQQQQIYQNALERKFDVAAANAALTSLATDPGAEWRLIWLLYVSNDLPKPESTFAPFLASVDTRKLSPLARCWLNRLLGRRTKSRVDVAALHDMSYLEAGQTLYGGA
jgi:hypothetical protein